MAKTAAAKRAWGKGLSGESARYGKLAGWEVAILAICLLALLGFAIASVVANATQNSRPDAALAFRPGNAWAAARLASAYSSQPGEKPDADEFRALALESLERDATAVRSLRAVGELASAKGEDDAALQPMIVADRLTKRDLPVQIWLFDHYLQQGDVDRLFDHVEVAVSTSRDANGYLFPVLAMTLADARFVDPMVELLSREPWWAPSLLSSIVEAMPSADNAVAVFTRLAAAGHPPRDDITEALAERLREEGNVSALQDLEPLLHDS